MAFNCKQFKNLIEETLLGFAPYMAKANAVNLLLGTAAVESAFGTYLKQLGRGPAVSVFQIEPATEKDIWENWLKFKPDLMKGLEEQFNVTGPNPKKLISDLGYAIVMARIFYLRKQEPIPHSDDIEALGRYWKTYYNTRLGKGTVDKFVSAFRKYVRCVRAEYPTQRK